MKISTKNNQSSEDYLESIYLLSETLPAVHRIDVAKRLNVSGAAVNKAVNLLLENGFVYEEGKHVFLTERGKAYAQRVYDRHCRLLEFFLFLGVSEENAEADACKIEHVLSEESFEKLQAFLDSQKTLN